MPDNMSPENPQASISPSVKAVMNLGAEEARNFPRPGAVVEFPGAAEQRKAAEEFPKLEYKSEPINLRMRVEEPAEGQDLSKDAMMNYMRSLQGRIQTSELLKFTESLTGILDTIKGGLNVRINCTAKKEEWELNLADNEKKYKEYEAQNNILDSEKDKDKIRELREKNSDLIDKRHAHDTLKSYEERLEKEKSRLPEQYGDTIDQCLNVVDELYDIGVDQKKNLAPYDHRNAVGTVKVVLATAAFVRKGLAREHAILEHDLEQFKQKTPATESQKKAIIEVNHAYEAQIKEISEIETWTMRTERDGKYLDGFVEVTVGQSASLPVYYDVVRQLLELNDGYRTQITENGLEKMVSKVMHGLEFNSLEQRTVIKDSRIGLDISEKDYGENGDKGPGLIEKTGEVLGLKELGTRFQDDSFEARMKAAAVSQCDIRDGTSHDEAVKTCFMGLNFNEDDLLFYKEVFCLKTINKKGEKKFRVLSPHVASKAREIKLADSRLEAILVTNAVRRLENISKNKNYGNGERENTIKALAKEVIKEAKERVKKWDSRADKDIVNRMAVLITRQGLLQDYSFMHAFRYCWKYDWKHDEEGNPTRIKNVDIAGVLSRSGDLASLYFYRRDLDYDKGSKSRTPWMLPSSEAGRLEVSTMPYDKMPKVYKSVQVMENGMAKFDKDGNPVMQFVFNQDELVYLPKKASSGNFEKDEKGQIIFEYQKVEKDVRTGLIDDFLREQLNFLLDDDPEYQKARKDLGYEFGFQKDVAEKLKEWAIRWRTPFSTMYVGADADVKRNSDMNIVVPVFLPELVISNFFEAITDGDGKLNKAGPDGKSIWTKLVESQAKDAVKMRMSDIQFNPENPDPSKELEINGIEDQPVNRWLIDEAMAANYMNIMINVFDKERDNFNNLVTGNPSTLGPKDFIKKMVLTFRDAEGSHPEEYEIALIPFFITLAVANKYGISGADAWNLPAGGKVVTTNVENFLAEMALWKRAFKWLSSDRPNDEFRYEKGTVGTKVDEEGFKLDENNKRIQIWKYGESMALMAEFYEPILLRMGKSSAEESMTLARENYKKTVARISTMPFMNTGRLIRKIDDKLFPQ